MHHLSESSADLMEKIAQLLPPVICTLDYRLPGLREFAPVFLHVCASGIREMENPSPLILLSTNQTLILKQLQSWID